MPLTDKKTYRYVYRGEKGGFGWFIVVLDETGFFSTVSDYGSYAYQWSAFSGDFRKFLCGCDAGYLISKLNPRKVPDWDQTYENVKQHILEERRGGFYSKDKARFLLNLAKDKIKRQSDFDFKDFLDEASNEDSHTLWHEFYSQKPEASIDGFARRLFPKLVIMMRTELESEHEPGREATAD